MKTTSFTKENLCSIENLRELLVYVSTYTICLSHGILPKARHNKIYCILSSDQILKLPVQTMGFHVDVVLVCDGFWSWYVCCMIGIKTKSSKNVKACFYIFNNKKFVGSIMRKLWAFSPQVRFILWDSLTNFVKNFHDFLLILPSYQISSLLFASYFQVKIWE